MKAQLAIVIALSIMSLKTREVRAQPAPEPAPMAPQPMAAPPPAQSVPPPAVGMGVDPEAHTHHGFFLRVTIGPAGFNTTTTIGADKYAVQGGGGGFGLALGGAISPNVVVYGEVFDDVAMGPTLKMNDQTVSTAGNNVNAGVVGVGPGLTYYTPSNIYLGATLAVARLTVQQDNKEIAHSGNGFGVSGMIGKEWWVSDNWGLGAVLQVFGGSIPDGQADTRWTTAGAMIGFSGSYN